MLKNTLEQRTHAKRAMHIAATALAGAVLLGCGGGGGSEPAQGGTPGSGTPSTPPAATGTITVGWGANSEPDLAGYKVYYGTSSGVYVQAKGSGLNAGLVTEYAISGLKAGTTYFVAVTSYDRSGNESNYSAQVSGVAK